MDDPVLGEPSDADVRFLEDRLYEFNVEATGQADGRGLGVFVRDEGGGIVAAAAGHTWGGTVAELLDYPAGYRHLVMRKLLNAAV